MDIYYTSLCADSMRFITDQLMPLYDDFQKHLDITFVPFGKARVRVVIDKFLQRDEIINYWTRPYLC